MNFKNLHFVVIPTREDDSDGALNLPQPVAGLALSGMDYPLLAAIPQLPRRPGAMVSSHDVPSETSGAPLSKDNGMPQRSAGD